MYHILGKSIFCEEIFLIDNESEKPNEIIIANNEQKLENELKEEDKHYNFNKAELDEVSFVEYKLDQKYFTFSNLKDNFKDEDEIFNEVKKIFPTSESSESIQKKDERQEEIKQDEHRFGLKSDQFPVLPSLPQTFVNNELKLFDESIKKEFSSKYSDNPIFKPVKLNAKRRRKNMKDNMRKRIKSDYCKVLKNKLNNMLGEYEIESLFDLPQLIVADVSKERNKNNLKMNLEEFLSEGVFINKYYKNEKKRKKKDNNSKFFLWKLVRKYLEIKEAKIIQESNKNILDILKNKGNERINLFLNKTMKDIYKEYLNSDHFENSIKDLKNEGNLYDYIHNYIKVAKNYVNFFINGEKVNEK